MWRHKGRSHMLRLIGHEFRTARARPLQLAARALVGRDRAFRPAVGVLGYTARILPVLRLRSVSHRLLSVLFNLLYFQGVAQALGEPNAFDNLVKTPVESQSA
jgi:hypothetical protein